jgi:hypothetical protein
LSSAVAHLDVWLGGNEYATHLHSIAWGAMMVALALSLYRRLLPSNWVLTAGVFYALDDSHVLPVMWWCNRNAVLAMVAGLAAVQAHLKWRDEGSARWAALSS